VALNPSTPSGDPFNRRWDGIGQNAGMPCPGLGLESPGQDSTAGPSVAMVIVDIQPRARALVPGQGGIASPSYGVERPRRATKVSSRGAGLVSSSVPDSAAERVSNSAGEAGLCPKVGHR